MEQYKISQNPGGGKRTTKSKKKKPAKAARRKQAKSLDPQILMVVGVIILLLALGGFAYARFFSNDEATTAANGAAQQAKEAGEVPEATFTGVTTAISNKKVGDLNTYYAAKVRVRILSKSINKTVSKAEVEALISNPLNSAQTPWNWNVPAELLSQWQTGPYSEYFVGTVIVGQSPDNTVIVIHLNENGEIESIFIAPASELTNPPATQPPATPPSDPVPNTPSDPEATTPSDPLQTSD